MRTLLGLSINPLIVALVLAQMPTTPATQSTPQQTEYKLEPVAIANATYPAEAIDKKIEGEVVASFAVSEVGDVTGERAFKCDPVLCQAVQDAISKWKFRPVMNAGHPIVVFGKASFRFALGDPSQLSNGVPPEIGPATDPPRKVRVSEGVSQGLLLAKVDPTYPESARKKGIQGVVLLHATINTQGSLVELQPISGPQELIPAAIDALKQWRYKPYLLMGLPIEVDTQIQVNFTLRR
jgi:TonB family protein